MKKEIELIQKQIDYVQSKLDAINNNRFKDAKSKEIDSFQLEKDKILWESIKDKLIKQN
jgi:hypothetical protein